MFRKKTLKLGPKAADYDKLGRQLENVLIKDYLELLQDTKRQLWLSLLRGVAAGLGGVIGATVMVALLVFILARLAGIPVVGDFFRGISHSLGSATRR